MTTQWLNSVDLGKWRREEGYERRRSLQPKYVDTHQYTAYNPRDSYYDEKRYMPPLRSTASNSTLKSISHQDHRHHKFYKPTSNRSLVLTLFLLVIAICIALLELARTTHYDVRDIPALPTLQARHLPQKRTDVVWVLQQADPKPASTPSIAASKSFMKSAPTSTISFHHHILPRQADGSPADADNADFTPNNFVAPTTTSLPLPNEETTTSLDTPVQPNGAGQVTVTKPDDSTTHGGGTGQPFGGGQLTVTDKDDSTTNGGGTGQPYGGGQLTVTGPDNGNGAQISTTGQISIITGQPDPGKLITITPKPSEGSQITITSEDLNGVVTSTPSAIRVTVTGVDGSSSVVTVPSQGSQQSSPVASVVSGSLIASGTSIIGTVPTTSHTGAVTMTNSQGVATATVSFTGAVVQVDSNGKPTATISYTTSSNPKATQEGSVLSNKNSSKSLSFTHFDYFLAMYLPNIICVILVSAWLIVSATFKMMEPFYQMASPGGAAAQSTLTADYFTSGLSFTFVRAALDGHWVMLLAGTVQLFLAVVLFLVAEAMHVLPTAYCKTELSNNQPCAPVWVVDTTVIRAMEVFLVGCFSLIVAILVLNRRRVSGVYSDPSKIATMADILVHKPLIQELRDIPPTAMKAEIEIDLRESRYMLGTFVADNRQQYGIIKLENDTSSSLVSEPKLLAWWKRISLSTENVQDRVHKNWPYLLDFISIALAIVLFMLILVYRLMPDVSLDKRGFNVWMSSGQKGPKFVLNGLAVTIGFLVKRRERILRLSHPYVLMSKKPQPASECITAGTRATQFTSLTSSTRTGNISLALLSLAAIFTDVLLILTPGVPQSVAQTKPVYESSTFCCLALLGFIVIIMMRVTFKSWRRGRHVECPDTLAAVLMRLCASQFVEEKNMAADEQDHLIPSFGEDDENKQRRRYEGLDGRRRYRFGCMEGVDGVQRYMVDEDMWERRAALDLGMQIRSPRD